MPQDSTALVIAICGLAIVFTGLGALATYFVLRMARGLFLGGLINRLMGGADMYAGKESTVVVTPKSNRNLRAKAEQLDVDFDQAVARYEGQGKPSPSRASSTPSSTPLADPTRRRGARRGRGESDPDEQFDALDAEDEDALG